MTKAALALAVVLLAGGCATQQASYQAQLDRIPTPVSAADRQQTCAWIHAEIARQQKMAAPGSDSGFDLVALSTQANARSRISALEAKDSEFRCSTVAGGGGPAPSVPPWERPAPVVAPPVVVAPGPSKIESCIAACKANTPRTPEQCFDACNH